MFGLSYVDFDVKTIDFVESYLIRGIICLVSLTIHIALNRSKWTSKIVGNKTNGL